MIKVEYRRNCVCQTAYHVVWCTKYRKHILIKSIAEKTGKLLDVICEENGWKVISKEIQPDHIHLFVSFPPVIAISDAMKKLKGITARKLFLKFPEVKKKLWGGSLWSPSYYVGTAGNVSAKIIKKYIERTEHMRGRR